MDKVIQDWDAAARCYSEFEATSQYSNFCRKFIINHFTNIQNKIILDAGCGNGNEQGIAISKKVSSYITPLAIQQNFWGNTMHFHRPISYYFNKIANVGFTLKNMIEPKVYEETKIPDIPLYLFAEFIK